MWTMSNGIKCEISQTLHTGECYYENQAINKMNSRVDTPLETHEMFLLLKMNVN